MAVTRYIPHYTVEDYRGWEGHWELWSGIPIAMSPSPDRVHQRLARRLVTQFDTALAETGCQQCEVFFELDWVVSEDTVFRPDVVISCEASDARWLEAAPRLIAEILSASSRSRDLVHKREAYAHLGVLYYLIVDPESESLTLLQNTGRAYTEHGRLDMTLDRDCTITLDLASLFSPA